MCVIPRHLLLYFPELFLQLFLDRRGQILQEYGQIINTAHLFEQILLTFRPPLALVKDLKLYKKLAEFINIVITPNDVTFDILSLFHFDHLFDLRLKLRLVNALCQVGVDVLWLHTLVLAQEVLMVLFYCLLFLNWSCNNLRITNFYLFFRFNLIFTPTNWLLWSFDRAINQ
jgi:hypothetical protein